MFRLVVHTKWFKALSLILSVYLLNLSIDLPDQRSQSQYEDLSFNDQESVIELFVETCLGYRDAFIEYDDADQNKQGVQAGFSGLTKACVQQFETSGLIRSRVRILFNPFQPALLSETIERPETPPRL